MILRLLLKMMLIIGIPLLLTVAIIRASAHDDPALTQFLLPADSCPLPCWQGIVPGETTRAEAVAILESHPWIDTLSHSRTGTIISWTWNGTQPAMYDQFAQVIVNDGVVSRVWLQLSVSIGDVHSIMGDPDNMFFAYETTGYIMNLMLDYEGLYVEGFKPCPASYLSLWGTAARIGLHNEGMMLHDIHFIPDGGQWRQLCQA